MSGWTVGWVVGGLVVAVVALVVVTITVLAADVRDKVAGIHRALLLTRDHTEALWQARTTNSALRDIGARLRSARGVPE